MTPELSFRIHTAAVTALSLVCTYALAFYWELDKPFWAGFTVFMISLPTIGQSLQKGVLRTFGTLMGAVIALLLLMFFSQERFFLLLALSLYMGFMLFFMSSSVYYGYFFFISCLVTVIIVLMAVRDPLNAFHLSVFRTEETLLGIGVYTVVTLIFSPQSSLDALYRNMHTLAEGHLVLFAMNDSAEEGMMGRIYAQYNVLHNIITTTRLLVPAVRLERYQVYHDRLFWERAVWCSGALLESQRKWAGTLVAMKELDLEALFPDFASKKVFLESMLQRLAQTGTENGTNNGKPVSVPEPTLDYHAETFSGLEAAQQSFVMMARGLFREQVRLCTELQALLSYLLEGGPVPALPAERPRGIAPVVTPGQLLNVVQALVIFWTAALLWIFLDPPGIESLRFLELTVVIGLSFLLTGQDKPLTQVLLFGVGSLCAGILYVFVYPEIRHVDVFMLVMFLYGFLIMFFFPRREQTFAKYAFMMPWLSIGNFTNSPTYSFTSLVIGLFVLMFGISLISLIHYTLFMPNRQALFLKKQELFFLSAGKMLDLLARTSGTRTPLVHRLRLLWRMHRTRYLADHILNLAAGLPDRFGKPELLQLFGMEIRDIVVAMHSLHEHLLLMDGRLVFPCPVPVAGNDVRARIEALQNRTQALLSGLQGGETVPACCRPEELRRMSVYCGSIMKALSNALGVMLSFPEEQTSWNRF